MFYRVLGSGGVLNASANHSYQKLKKHLTTSDRCKRFFIKGWCTFLENLGLGLWIEPWKARDKMKFDVFDWNWKIRNGKFEFNSDRRKNQSPFNKRDVCLSFGKFRSKVGWYGSVARLGDHATVVVGSFRPILANTMANDARLSPYNISRNRRQLTLGQ